MKNWQRIKLKLEKFFIYELWQHLIVVAFVLSFAWIFDRILPAILFCMTHLIVRPMFEKQFHQGTTSLCLFTTFTIGALGIYSCLPVSISLLSAIPVATFVCWVGYIAQDRIDMSLKLKPNLKTISLVDFNEFCLRKGLTNYETYIAKLIIRDNLKGECLYNTIKYSKSQTLRIKKKIMELLLK